MSARARQLVAALLSFLALLQPALAQNSSDAYGASFTTAGYQVQLDNSSYGSGWFIQANQEQADTTLQAATQPQVGIQQDATGRLTFTVDAPQSAGTSYYMTYTPLSGTGALPTVDNQCVLMSNSSNLVTIQQGTYEETIFSTDVFNLLTNCSDASGQPVVTSSDTTDANGNPATKYCAVLYVSAVASAANWQTFTRYSVVAHQYKFCTVVDRMLTAISSVTNVPTIQAQLVSAQVSTNTYGQQFLALSFATRLAIRQGTNVDYLAGASHVQAANNGVSQLHSTNQPACQSPSPDPSSCVQLWTWESLPVSAQQLVNYGGKYVFIFAQLMEDGTPATLDYTPTVTVQLDVNVHATFEGAAVQYDMGMAFFRDAVRTTPANDFRKGERVYAQLSVPAANDTAAQQYRLIVKNVWVCAPIATTDAYGQQVVQAAVWNPAAGQYGCKNATAAIPADHIAQLIDTYQPATTAVANLFSPMLDYNGYTQAGFAFDAAPLSTASRLTYYVHVEAELRDVDGGYGRRLHAVSAAGARRQLASSDPSSSAMAPAMLNFALEDAPAGVNMVYVYAGVGAGVGALLIAVAALLVYRRRKAQRAAAAGGAAAAKSKTEAAAPAPAAAT